VFRISADLEALANLIFVASDLVHGEHAKRRWQPKTISISALAEDLEAEAQVYSKPGGTRFACKILPGVESISTEPVRLKIILRSILLNAIKTAEQATVTLEIARDKGSAVFTISDPNAALSEEEAAQFLAASPPQSPRLKKTESLFLVERLLELIGGSLTVQRGQARGIIYRITLADAIQ
jgi:signal transduction histidine kinase